MKVKVKIAYIVIIAFVFNFAAALAYVNPKYEFRGAWISTVYQEQYAKQSTLENKQYIRNMLDKLKEAGINAVLFQVRPSADAFYDSKYEMWSRFLTTAGQAPQPYWDPLKFITEEAHARGMELHAWINPYRVTTAKNERLPKNHLYYKEPERFVRYEGDGKIYFDPGHPKNREHIIKVINDIVDRYDIDAIHFDDYFYPYPVKGKTFNDTKTYKKYGKGLKLADWRRQNVDKLIEEVNHAIRHSKRPWVRFGISPFGIWRNASSDPKGSKTNGLQNYDDLYADVLLWAKEGWIDYLIPQLYWELEHPKASSLKLIDWWDKAVDKKCHVYIGQDVERTMNKPDIAPSKEKNQLKHKIDLSRAKENVLGNCWWPAYSVISDFKGVAKALKKGAQSTPALVPPYTHLSSKQPDSPSKLKAHHSTLTWKAPKEKGKMTDPSKYVVYRFDDKNEIDFADASAIMAITPETEWEAKKAGYYAVTTIDKVNNESNPSNIIYVK